MSLVTLMVRHCLGLGVTDMVILLVQVVKHIGAFRVATSFVIESQVVGRYWSSSLVVLSFHGGIGRKLPSMG